MKKKNLTTKANFEFFIAECKKWINNFNLNCWDVWYTHEELEHDLAQCTSNHGSMTATIKLGVDFRDTPVTKEILVATALHEICHLLVAKLAGAADDRYTDKEIVDAYNEEIANSLSKFLLKEERPLPKKKKTVNIEKQ